MTNKEKFLSLVSTENNETKDAIHFRNENKSWLHESKRIAIKILKAIKEQSMSQKNLAEQMDVSPQYVNKLVKGKENLTIETLIKLQSILDISLLASHYEKQNAAETSYSVQMFNIKTHYQRVEFSEYNPLEKKVAGYE